MPKPEHRHWMDEFVGRLMAIGRDHVVESGTSISGPAHIGNACDVILAEAVRRLIEERGGRATSIWVADDMDPLDSIPFPIDPSTYRPFLGMPYVDIPDPSGCCRSWAEHFTNDFLNSLERLDLRPVFKSGASMYRDGTYLPFIRVSLREAEEIRRIFAEVSGAKKPPSWLPYMPICEGCGRISTTLAYAYDGDRVAYRCVLDAGYARGCGYEGEVDVKEGRGKLQWRVEWAARWAALKVTVEPFGKEHAAAGGSYDTSKVISEELFSHPAPSPLVYEHVMIRGRKMSKSKGLVFTPRDWLEVAPPESLKFFFFRVHPTRHKDFSAEEIPRIVSEYDRAERIYYGAEEAGDEKSSAFLKRSYELSQAKPPPPSMPAQLPYDFAAVLLQIYPDLSVERALELMARTGHLKHPPTEIDAARVAERLSQVKSWLAKYAPPSAKIKLLSDPSSVTDQLSEAQRSSLRSAAKRLLSRREWSPQELNNEFFSIARGHGLEPSEFFEAAYLALLGRRSGPWLANFTLALGVEEAAKRLLRASGFQE
ncbi:MAG: lysine--tRNA ligase [Candidatus Nezhaarchaeota archaeon]|nr:lysine--tRNA ligase [Candidatus Nezhaarchaeota archaeon]